MKNRLCFKVIVIVVISFGQLFAVTIYNPYTNGVFMGSKHVNFHSHAQQNYSCGHSDVGEHDITYMKNLYNNSYFKFYFPTAQSKCAYCANGDTTKVLNGAGEYMYGVKGTEVVNCTDNGSGSNHLLSLFAYSHPVVDANNKLTMTQAVNKILSDGGLAIIAHPGRYYLQNQTKYYGCKPTTANGNVGWMKLFQNITNPNFIGVEVWDANGHARGENWDGVSQWDSILSYSGVAASRKIWGFADDDTHYGECQSSNYSDMYQAWNEVTMSCYDWELNEQQQKALLKQKVLDGCFYMCFGSSCDDHGAPYFMAIAVSGTTITACFANDVASATWKKDWGATVKTVNNISAGGSTSINVATEVSSGTKYVRLEAINSYGRCLTQPFKLTW